jgi:hypothetical protein
LAGELAMTALPGQDCRRDDEANLTLRQDTELLRDAARLHSFV